jgi:hypothetical protein
MLIFGPLGVVEDPDPLAGRACPFAGAEEQFVRLWVMGFMVCFVTLRSKDVEQLDNSSEAVDICGFVDDVIVVVPGVVPAAEAHGVFELAGLSFDTRCGYSVHTGRIMIAAYDLCSCSVSGFGISEKIARYRTCPSDVVSVVGFGE